MPQHGYITKKVSPERLEFFQAILAVFDEYEAHRPLTVRQVFYRLVAQGIIEKGDTDRYVQRVGTAITDMRRMQLLPFDWVRDDKLKHESPHMYGDESPNMYIHNVLDTISSELEMNSYHRYRHEGQPHAMIFWCEAAGMLPQVARVALRYGAEVYSSSGTDSLTGKKQFADRIVASDRPVHLFHIGDLDPHGKYIYNALVDDVAAFIEHDGGSFTFERLALTEEQIDKYKIPMFGDKQQAEALSPPILAEIVREACERLYDKDLASRVEAREREERAEVEVRLAQLREQINLPDR